MSNKLEVEPVNELFEEKLKDTQLLKHIPFKTVRSVELEYTLDDYPYDGNMKMFGGIYFDDNINSAMASLVQKIEQQLFFGDPDSDAYTFPGLQYIARQHEDVTGKNMCYSDSEKFYDRYETTKDTLNLRLFTPHDSVTLPEGMIPPPMPTFAVNPNALLWNQLMAPISVSLVPMREGKLTASLTPEPVQFTYENSEVRHRYVLLAYGTLQVLDSDSLFVLV